MKNLIVSRVKNYGTMTNNSLPQFKIITLKLKTMYKKIINPTLPIDILRIFFSQHFV